MSVTDKDIDPTKIDAQIAALENGGKDDEQNKDGDGDGEGEGGESHTEDAPEGDEGGEGDGGEHKELTAEEKAAQAAKDKEAKENWQKRYSDSSREGQILFSKNKDISNAYQEAAKVPPPTDEEMVKQFPDWETMTTTEQYLARENVHTKKKDAVIGEAMTRLSQTDTWIEKVDEFANDPVTEATYPKIAGREAEFRAFCMKPTHLNAPMAVLASAFSFEVKSQPPKKGEMFHRANGGDGAAPKPKANEYTAEQAATLRKSNPKEYNKLAAAGKINVQVE